MTRKLWILGLAVVIAGGLITGIYVNKTVLYQADQSVPVSAKGQVGRKSHSYLGKEYILPDKIDKIVVTGALEALEDLLVLGVKPVGVMTIGGTFPTLFADITKDAKPIGERMQPSFEAILKIRPDVILSSDKFPASTAEQLKKIAPTIPISHFPIDGKANLLFLGELTGKQEQAKEVLRKYEQDAAAAKVRLPEGVKDKKVIAVRIRAGNIGVYPANVFLNEILYGELGLSVPEEIKAVKAQEVISLEKFSEMDPDYIFLQYAVLESPAQPNVLKDLQQNPIWRSMKAVKNNNVFINVVDPLVQGVAIGGKIQFLNAAIEKLSQ
ncbi:ABC transporter substrate-binding protein [Pelosinus fermentans]|uniref:ABC-type transporter, periplasmic subunit n=1 Tax=Pelosinus fermentans JBW45 TaxID=1192197 RepID=I8TRE3_9FIRM|nr:ABC transporter substrate-binding protein [Pelosinus fermentans]AJQ25488.1 ABC-type transporter, periplasmic subunit [Pelosinus fermentans JBW45]